MSGAAAVHGGVVMRRQFALPEEDTAFLNCMGCGWETVRDDKSMWLLIHGLSVPEGYNVTTVSLALMIMPTYPDAQIDMAYFFPALSLTNGSTIRQLAQHLIEGKSWQRWSRHRTRENPWRPGEDSVSTHLALVNNWLERAKQGK